MIKKLSKFLLKTTKTLFAFCCIGTVVHARQEHWPLNHQWKTLSLVEKIRILDRAWLELEASRNNPAYRGVLRLVINGNEVYLSNESGKGTLSTVGSWFYLPTASSHNGNTTDAILEMFPREIDRAYLIEKIFEGKGKYSDLRVNEIERIKALAIKHIPEAKECWEEETEKEETPVATYERSEVVVSTEWLTKPDGSPQTIEKQIAILLDCCKRLNALSMAGFDNYSCFIKEDSVVIAVVDPKEASSSKETYEAMETLARKLAIDYSMEGNTTNVTSATLVSYLKLLRDAYLDSLPERKIAIDIPKEWRKENWKELESYQKKNLLTTISDKLKENPDFRLVIDGEGNVYLSNITTAGIETIDTDWLCGNGSKYQTINKTTWIGICGANDEEKTIGWLRDVFRMSDTDAGSLWGKDITKDNIDKIRQSIRYY